MGKDHFQRINSQTLRDSVSTNIRNAIIDGTLSPGESINHSHMAERFGISRGPIREAIAQLEEEGLVRTVPYKGAFVTDITLDYIEELYSLRLLLELFAIERTVERIDPAGLEDFRSTISEMRKGIVASDLKLTREADIRFHYLIYAHAQHSLLMSVWKAVETGMRRVLSIGHGSYADPREILGTHPDIFAAIEAKYARKAKELLEAHIRESGEAVYKSWDAFLSSVEQRDVRSAQARKTPL